MLASLLPGLRDLRTPLVTGYLYLLAIWMTYGGGRLLPNDSNVFASRLMDLREFVGVSFTVASVSIVAYLIGSLLVVRSTSWLEEALLPQPRMIGRWRNPFWAVVDALMGPLRPLLKFLLRRGEASKERLEDWLKEEARDLHRRGVQARVVFTDPVLPGRFTSMYGQIWEHQFPAERAAEDGQDWSDELVQYAYLSDRSQIALERALVGYVLYDENEALIVRLQIDQPPLFDAYDRLQSESEFRLSIFAPLVWLVTISAFLLTPWTVLLVAIPLALAYQALRLQGQAQERITQALTSGAIDSPVLKRLRALGEAQTVSSDGDSTDILRDLRGPTSPQ